MASTSVLLLVFIFQLQASAFFHKSAPKCDVSQVPVFEYTTLQITEIHPVRETITATVTRLTTRAITTTIPHTIYSVYPITTLFSQYELTETYVVTTTVRVPVGRIQTTTISVTESVLNIATNFVTNYHTVFDTVGVKDTLLRASTHYETLVTDVVRAVYEKQTSTVMWTETNEQIEEVVETVHDPIPATITSYLSLYNTVTNTRSKMVTITVCPEQHIS